MANHNLKIVNQISELERISLFLEQLGEQYGLSMKVTMNLNLVLEELITNIIFYGFKDNSEHEIQIDIVVDDEKVRVDIEDEGKYYDPTQKDIPDSIGKPIEEQQIGGLGIHLVKNLMDSFTYERVNNKNIIHLIKIR